MDASKNHNVVEGDKFRSTSFVICVDQGNGHLTWLRTHPHNSELIIVESSNYGNPVTGGYSMLFKTVEEYLSWFADKTVNGWRITFIGETEPLDIEHLSSIRNKILEILRAS